MATHSHILTWRIPKERGAWWATVHRVAKSWTGLKQLSLAHATAISRNSITEHATLSLHITVSYKQAFFTLLDFIPLEGRIHVELFLFPPEYPNSRVDA